MRHIDLSSLQIPDNWLRNSDKALKKLTKIVQRKALFGQIRTNKNDIISLKRVVSQLNGNESESELATLKRLLETTDKDVDLVELNKVIGAIEQLDKQLNISEEIEKYANSTWRALKPYLSRLVEGIIPNDDHPDGKCWYCESRFRMRLLEVDHYRPKAAVRGDNDYKSELGYWWLAFDYRNFRLSCQICNRLETGDDNVTRGKGTWFPLVDENKRAYNNKDVGNETPLLLDPTNAADARLLVFFADGRVEPSSLDPNSLDYQRAKRSIDVYHLNAPFDKRLAICREIQNLILEADLAYRTSIASENETIKSEQEALFVRKISRIGEYLQVQSAYSMAARSEAQRQAQKYDWVEDIIE